MKGKNNARVRIRRKKAALTLLLVLFLTFLLPAWDQPLGAATIPIPSPDSRFYVLDQADILSRETEDKIVALSDQLQQKTKAQVVVVTVQSLEDYPLEDFSLAILRQWGIGDKELNNGVLLLVSLADRASRIEVGYGLEGALPDAKTGGIQDEYMIPYFQKGDYDQGIANGYLAILQVVAGEYNVTLDSTAAPRPVYRNTQPAPADSLPTWAYVLGVIGIILLLYLDARYMNGFFLSLLLSMLLRGGRGGGGGGGFGGGGGSGGGGSSRRW